MNDEDLKALHAQLEQENMRLVKEAMKLSRERGTHVTLPGEMDAAAAMLFAEEEIASRRKREGSLLDRKEVNPKVTKKEDWALNAYKNGLDGCLTLNSDLRAGKPIKKGSQADLIERAINKADLPEDTVVYRGVDAAAFPSEKLVGSTFSDKAFVSTSLDEAVAIQFDAGVLMEIRLPAGTKALSMTRWAEGEGVVGIGTSEAELLLQRGSRFKVIKDVTTPETRQVVVELVP